MRRSLISYALVPFVAVTAACRSDTGASAFQEKDSSGVTIAESFAPSWTDESRWALSDQPTLQIGVEDGDAMYQFFRVSAARWLPSNRIVVANSGSSTLRFYDYKGHFLREVGGAGDGPGEFRRLVSVERYRTDSLVVLDADLRRISVFTANGDFVRTIQLQQAGPEPLYGAYPLDDGSFVVGTLSAMPSGKVTPGLHRSPQPIYRYDTDGALLDTVAILPGDEISVSGTGRDMMMGVAPFGRVTAVDVQNDLIYVGTGEELEVKIYSPLGDLKRLVRGPDYRHAIAKEDIERHLAEFLKGIDNPTARGQIEKRLREMEFPRYWPPYSEILVDSSGNIWAACYPDIFRQKPSSKWMVFSSSGQLLGDMSLPERTKVLDITPELIIGVWTDEFDLEYIRVYELTKDEASAQQTFTRERFGDGDPYIPAPANCAA